MKTTPWDFVLSGLCILGLTLAAAAVTAAVVAPLTAVLLGPYHVLADALVFLFSYGLASGALVRGILTFWPLAAGAHSMESPDFTRWKLCSVLHEIGRHALCPFVTVLAKPLVARLFGARVGANVALGGTLGDPWLVELGNGAVVGHGSAVVAHAITSGSIVLQPVRVGNGATVGVNAVLMPGTEVGDGSVVAAGSVVLLGTRIPPGELWAGAPARRIKALEPTDLRG